MHPTTISILGLAVAGLVFAQTSTVYLNFPDFLFGPMNASIVDSDEVATTYAITCATAPTPTTGPLTCSLTSTLTYTEGPSTLNYHFPAPTGVYGRPDFIANINCSLARTTSAIPPAITPAITSAVCLWSRSGKRGAGYNGIQSLSQTNPTFEVRPVVITAGLATSSGGSPNLAGPSTTGASPEATDTSTGSVEVSALGETSTGVPQPTSSKSAAVAAVMGNKALVLGSAAVAIAMMG